MTEVSARFAVATGADERYMRAALDVARRGLLAGEPPIGACLVGDGGILASSNNGVISELDATAHAEIRVIREACRERRTLSLDGCTLYATVEPCPMCLGACHYAGVRRVVFGATLEDIHRLTGGELRIDRAAWSAAGLEVALTGPCLADECRELLAQWPLRSHR